MSRCTTMLLLPLVVMSLAGVIVSQNPPVVREPRTQPITQPHLPAQATTTNNTALTGAVMQKLITDPLLKNYAITVNPGDNGTVTLNGVVPAEDLVQRAIAVARTAPGVTQVTSQMLVVTDPFAPPPQLPAANSVPIGQPPPPPPVSNSTQAKLADALSRQAAYSRVGVRVREDQILLFGSVTSKADKAKAEAIVHELAPQLPVNNILWVDEHPLSPPPVVPGS
jgi:osmotically-inducible protein OsmY